MCMLHLTRHYIDIVQEMLLSSMLFCGKFINVYVCQTLLKYSLVWQTYGKNKTVQIFCLTVYIRFRIYIQRIDKKCCVVLISGQHKQRRITSDLIPLRNITHCTPSVGLYVHPTHHCECDLKSSREPEIETKLSISHVTREIVLCHSRTKRSNFKITKFYKVHARNAS